MTKQKRWVELFEQVIGRKPSPLEFQKAKEGDFDFKQIKSIAGMGITQVGSSLEPTRVQPQLTVANPDVSKQGTKKKSIFALVGLASLVLLAGAGFYYGKQMTSPKIKVEALRNAVAENKYDTVAQLLSESGEKWEKAEAKAFVDYLDSQETGLSEILSQLENTESQSVYSDQQKNKLLGLEEIGKQWGIFPKYEFKTYPLELTVTSDLDNLKIDGQSVESGERIPFKSSHFLPQTFNITGETDLGEIESEVVVDPGKAEQNQLDLSLNLIHQNLTVSLPFDSSQVENLRLLVNDKEVAKGLEAKIEVLENQQLEVKATFELNGQGFESKTSSIMGTSQNNVSLSFSDEDNSQIETLLAKKLEKRQAQVLWNPNKASQLADFMVSWGNSMNQPGYKNITNEETAYVTENRVRLNQVQDVTTEFSQDGTGNSDYQVLAIYRYVYEGNRLHTYYFTIRSDGAPIVLYSAQNQGGQPDDKFYMKVTANEELKAGFVAIVNQ